MTDAAYRTNEEKKISKYQIPWYSMLSTHESFHVCIVSQIQIQIRARVNNLIYICIYIYQTTARPRRSVLRACHLCPVRYSIEIDECHIPLHSRA